MRLRIKYILYLFWVWRNRKELEYGKGIDYETYVERMSHPPPPPLD